MSDLSSGLIAALDAAGAATSATLLTQLAPSGELELRFYGGAAPATPDDAETGVLLMTARVVVTAGTDTSWQEGGSHIEQADLVGALSAVASADGALTHLRIGRPDDDGALSATAPRIQVLDSDGLVLRASRVGDGIEMTAGMKVRSLPADYLVRVLRIVEGDVEGDAVGYGVSYGNDLSGEV